MIGESLVLPEVWKIPQIEPAEAADLPRKLLTLDGHEAPVRGLTYSPDGSLIASGSVDGTAKIWDVKTGEEKKYAMTRNEWSIHFNISPDQKLFAGDGGDPGQVAKAKDGQWIYLFTPSGDSLQSKKLVNMKHHNYKLEPNVHFRPDGKWIIFRANFEGHTDVYAVKINPSGSL